MTVGSSTVDEPYLTIWHEQTRFFLRARFLWSFLPIAFLALAGVLVLVYSNNALLPFERTIVVEGKLASKTDYFLDPQVQEILLRHHLSIHLTTAGSRDIATHSLDGFDFVFPSGEPAGNMIIGRLRDQGRSTSIYKPFTSPIVLATYRTYAETLRSAGVATAQEEPGGADSYYYQLDMPKFLQLTQAAKRWNDIGAIPSANRVTAFTSDICLSNSAATYMALVAFVLNNNDVPQTGPQADDLARRVHPLVTVTGMPSADLFNTYVTPEGKGAPIVAVYEHQFLSYQVRFQAQNGRLDRDRVLLYPSVNFRTEPQFIPLSPLGEKVGALLTNDAGLRRRATELGFRLVSRNSAPTGSELPDFLSGRAIPAPAASHFEGTAAQLPRQELLEQMITLTGNCPPT